MKHVIAYLRDPHRAIAWTVLLAAFGVNMWLYFTNADTPPARLFLTYWYIYVPAAVAALLAYVVILRRERRR